MPQAVRKRETFLELIRIAACFLVIVNHTASDYFIVKSPAETAWFLGVAYFFLSKPAVLLFYMISGYLLLGRRDSWAVAWKRIRRILVTLLCCAAVYALYQGRDLGQAFWDLFREPPSNALWYLYTYLGLLIMLPFLQRMAAAMEKRDYWIMFGMTGFFVGTVPIFSHYWEGFRLVWAFELPLFSNAVAMLFAGHYFARFGVKRSGRGFVLALFLVIGAVVFSTGATWWEYRITEGTDYLFFDDRTLLPNMIASVSLFYLAGFVPLPAGLEKAVTCLGSCTFGMYLMGDLLLVLMQPVHDALKGMTHSLIALVLFEISVMAASFVLTWTLRRIPLVRKIL